MRFRRKQVFLLLLSFYILQTACITEKKPKVSSKTITKRNADERKDAGDYPDVFEQETGEYGMSSNVPTLSGKSLKNYEIRELSSLKGFNKDDEDDIPESFLSSPSNSQISSDPDSSFSEGYTRSSLQTPSAYIHQPAPEFASLRTTSYNELPPLKKDSICGKDVSSPNCVCIESCAPNSVYSYDPCQCLEISENKENAEKNSHTHSPDSINEPTYSSPATFFAQPPILPNQALTLKIVPEKPDQVYVTKMPVSYESSNFIRDECAKPMNYYKSECVCRRSCYAQDPTSKYPCRCSESNRVEYMPSLEKSATSNDNSYGPSFFLNMVSEMSDKKVELPTFQTPKYDNQAGKGMFTEQEKYLDSSLYCDRSCVPYPVSSYSPCTCTYDTPQIPLSQGSQLPYNSFMTPQINYPNPSYAPQPSVFPYGNMNAMASNPHVPYGPFPGYQSRMPEYRSQFYPPQKVSYTPKATYKSYYLGCFRDKNKPGRDLKVSAPVPNLTPQGCVDKCKQLHKRFAAVQYGYLCFCGSRFGRYGRVDDEKCSTTCIGDPQKKCGGVWLNSVYSTDGQRYHEKQFSFSTEDPQDEIAASKAEAVRLKSSKASKKPKKPAIKPSKRKNPAAMNKKDVKLHKNSHNKNKSKSTREANFSSTDILVNDDMNKKINDLEKYIAEEAMHSPNKSNEKIKIPKKQKSVTTVKNITRRKDVAKFIHHQFSSAGRKSSIAAQNGKISKSEDNDSSKLQHLQERNKTGKTNTSIILKLKENGKLQGTNETEDSPKRNIIRPGSDSEVDDIFSPVNETESQAPDYEDLLNRNSSMENNATTELSKNNSQVVLTVAKDGNGRKPAAQFVNKQNEQERESANYRDSHPESDNLEDDASDVESPRLTPNDETEMINDKRSKIHLPLVKKSTKDIEKLKKTRRASGKTT